MNKKVIAGLAALALFCGSVPAYNAFLNRASISASAVETNISEFLNGYTSKDNKTSISKEIQIAGRTYAQGIVFSGFSNDAFSVTYDVSAIKSLGFTAGHVDGSGSGSNTLIVYLDDVKSEEIDLTSTMRTKDFTIDTSSASAIRLEMKSVGNSYALVDFKLDKAGSANPYYVPTYSTPEAFLKRSFDASNSVTVKTSAYTRSDQSSSFSINGRKHYQGLTFTGYSNDTAAASYNVENVKTMSFTAGHVDNSDKSSATLHIYLDNVEAETKKLTWSMAAEDITLDVSDASVVRFEVTFGGNSTYALADFTVDGTAPEMAYTTPSYESPEEFLKSCYDGTNSVTNNVYYYAKSDQASSFQMGGRSYYQGLKFSGYSGDTGHISFNVENLETVSFTLGHIDDSGSDSGTVTAYLDGKKAAEYKISRNSLWQEVTLDVKEASILWIEVSYNGNSAFGVGDFRIDSTKAEIPHTVPTYDSAEKLIRSGYNYNKTVYLYTDDTIKIADEEHSGISLGSYPTDLPCVTYNVETVDSLTFTLGYPDGADQSSGTLQIFKNNKLVDEVAVTPNMGTATYALDTSDASTISLYFKINSYTTLALVDYKLNEKITTPGLGEKIPTESADTGLFGDINGDGAINAKDANEILRYAAYVGTGGSMTLREYVAQ